MWDYAPSVESLHHIVAKLVWIRMMKYFSVAFSEAFHIRFFVFVSFPLPSLYLFIYLLIWLTTLLVAFFHFYIYQTRLVLLTHFNANASYKLKIIAVYLYREWISNLSHNICSMYICENGKIIIIILSTKTKLHHVKF